METLLAQPRGFCAGVVRAIEIVERALKHTVRPFMYFTKSCIEEVEGTRGSIDGIVHVVSTAEAVAGLQVQDPERLAYVTQTTLSLDDTRDVIDALTARFPHIRGPDLDDICYVTQNRQNAVKALSAQVGLLLVVGARNSSNSNRLRETGAQFGIPAYLIRDETEIDPKWVTNVERVGVTAGASTPEILVQRVVQRLAELGSTSTLELDGIRETTTFSLPKSLRDVASPADGGARRS